MFSMYFKEYPSGSWEELEPKGLLSSLGKIKRGIESDKPGEAGLLKYDKLSSSFYYSPGNVIHNKLSINLDGVDRYMFSFYALKENKTEVKAFEGVVDFDSISEPDLSKKISFNIAVSFPK